MSLPTHATTYQLSRTEVSGQQATEHRDGALKALAAAGIPAAVEADGVLRGVLPVEPRRFYTLPGAPIAPRQAFEIVTPGTLRFADPSPLSQLGDLPFLEFGSLPKLTDRLVRAWSQRVQLIEAAVLAARRLAPNAQLYGDPWRIEGEVSFERHVVRMMFSTRGDRACVCAIDGRPVDRAPVRRKILPVGSSLTEDVWLALLADAVVQATPCLGPPVVTRDERQLSIDLASRDLELRPVVDWTTVGSKPTVVGPPAEPPPRMPPPPRLPPASDPRATPLMVEDADVLLSVDLSTGDLP